MAEEANEIQKNEYNFLIYKHDTYGTYGQHEKIIKLIIDVNNKSQKPLWEVISDVKWENNDSRKNKHREAYVRMEDIMSLKGKILKEVYDYQSSRKREINVKYYYISDKLQEIQTETGVKVNGKYYDILTLEGKKILVNKDEVIVQ
jgi:hypothetical protein